MVRKSISILTALLLIFNVTGARAAQKMTEARAAQLLNYYYIDPEPAKVIPALEFFLDSESHKADQMQFAATLHFFAAAARNDGTVMEQLKGLKEEYSGVKADDIARVISEAEDFVSPDCDSEESLAFLWSEFFATGERGPLKKIIKALGLPQKGFNIIVTDAAQRSLLFYARRHEKVYEAIEKESSSARGEIKKKLKEILEDYERAVKGIRP